MEKEIVDKIMFASAETDPIKIIGDFDVIVQGLIIGSITLMYKPRRTENLPSPTWEIYPGEVYTSDVVKVLKVNDYGTEFKLVGSADVSVGSYVRLAYFK